MARKICDFNHISPELNQEQIDELIGYYKTTHQKCFLYKKAHKHYKLIKYAARLTSGAIAGGGIASVIVSGSVLTRDYQGKRVNPPYRPSTSGNLS